MYIYVGQAQHGEFNDISHDKQVRLRGEEAPPGRVVGFWVIIGTRYLLVHFN